MFKLFKTNKKEFINATDASIKSEAFLGSGKYDKTTMKLIKDIQKNILYLSNNGFRKLEYDNHRVNNVFNRDSLIGHFERCGYEVESYYFKSGFLSMVITWR